MKKDIAIYSFNVAQDLVRSGHTLLNMELNTKVRGKLVFYFDNNSEVLNRLSEKHSIEIKQGV